MSSDRHVVRYCHKRSHWVSRILKLCTRQSSNYVSLVDATLVHFVLGLSEFVHEFQLKLVKRQKKNKERIENLILSDWGKFWLAYVTIAVRCHTSRQPKFLLQSYIFAVISKKRNPGYNYWRSTLIIRENLLFVLIKMELI